MSLIGGPQGRAGKASFVFLLVVIAATVGALSYEVQPGSSEGPAPGASSQELASFQDPSQLLAYVNANAKSAQQYNRWGVGFGGVVPFGGLPAIDWATAFQAAASGGQAAPTFTGTNVQVQGVDEPDRVKTDGRTMLISSRSSVSIINVTLASSAQLVQTIKVPSGVILGIEASPGRVMVITQGGNPGAVAMLLYDTSALSSPKLMKNVTIPGSYVAARLAEGYLYAIVQQPAYAFNGGNATATMPDIFVDGQKVSIPPTSVYYTPDRSQVSYYTMVTSVAMDTGQQSTLAVLTGPSATVYVSTSNIYVVYTNYLDVFDADGIPGDVYTGGTITVEDVRQAQNSTVLKVSYSNGSVAAAAAGVVPGSVLNQFSLDEYEGHFRVATSRFAIVAGTPTTSDDVYVLDQNLSQVSDLRNIAPGENIYAVRFVGDLGYVVTFEQVDPLFVISFSDFKHPVILSALKANGYSDYLFPLWGGYIIGVGKDTVPASQGNYAYYLGLKLSLFRVFHDGASQEVSRLLIGDRGTDSPVLSDHLAFTFDPSKNVTVIPLTLYKAADNRSDIAGVPPYGSPVWQGVFVIKVTPSGFEVLGKVSQYPAGQNYGDYPNDTLSVDRSVIIGDALYTVSQGELMVSNMSTFATLSTVSLPG
jgi:inhibitor of cysteine peptidase